MGVIIRQSARSDRDAIIAAKYTDPEPEIRAVVKTRRGSLAVGALLYDHGIEAVRERTVVAEVDGVVAGMMETLLPGQHIQLDWRTYAAVLGVGLVRLGPVTLFRYLRYARAQARVDIDHPQDSHYVAHLNVHPEFRNQGIGAALLAEAERQAREAGLRRLSLSMYITNPAQHLYERTGYRIVETKTDAAFERLVGVPGYVLMVKELG